MLALATALLGGGAVGFATAAGEDGLVFSVPMPMGGDLATYKIAGREGDALDQAYLEVRAPAPFLLQDGSWVSAYALRRGREVAASSNGFTESVVVGWDEAFVDAAGGEVVAFSDVSGSSASSDGSEFGFLLGSSEAEAVATSYVRYGAQPVPCGARSALQGRSEPVGDHVWVEGCGDGAARTGFRVEGVRDLEGRPSLVLVSDHEARRLWFQEGIPYPVRFEASIDTPEPDVLTLIGFDRGEEALVPGPVPARVDLPAVGLAASDRYGPAPGGWQHPFPIPAAVEHAQAHSQEVADFLAGHPDWFVRAADHRLEDRDGTLTDRWELDLHGGDQALSVQVSRPRDAAPNVLPPEATRLVAQLEEAVAEETFDQPSSSGVEADGAEDDEEWPAECRSARLPSVGAVAARWSAMQPEPTAANSYGFRLDCFTFSGDVAPRARVFAGDARIIFPAAPSDPLTEDDSQSSTQVLTRLVAHEDGHFEVERSATAVSRSTGLGQRPQGTPPQSIERVGGGVWATPEAPIAASITLVSILAGVLYWLWPVLKAGPLGLFSRLQGPQLLDHPVRKELMQRIEAQPGLHYQDLVRAMGKGKGAVEHHLRKLQDGGLVKSIAAGGYTCFFPVAFDRRLTAAAPALKSAGARRVLAAIQANPGASATTIGALTGLSPAAVNHHLQRLGAAGLVDVLRNGRSLSLQPTALASQVAAANQEAVASA